MSKEKRYARRKRKVRRKRQDELTPSAVHSDQPSISLERLPEHQTTRPLRNQAVLQAQGEFGNVHVQRMLEQAAPNIQRYESPEHQDIGDAHLQDLYEHLQTPEGEAWARTHGLPANLVESIAQDEMRITFAPHERRVGKRFRTRSGVELTVGDVIALMGDLYPTWQSILNAPADQLRGHLETMRLERLGQISADEATIRYERISEGAYLRLAQQNIAHFAPRNQTEWQEIHEEAMQKARESGNDKAAYEEALFMDAAAGHFLTDAFAAGHLFDKNVVVAEILSYLQTHPVQVDDPEMQLYVSAAQFSGKLHQLVLKNIHDRLNAEGFEISNEQDMTWHTYGDASLDNETAAETRHIAALAVFMSRQQIVAAREGNTPDSQTVLDLLPNEASVERATDVALTYIPQAAEEVPDLILRNRGTSRLLVGEYLGRWVEAHLATIGLRSAAARRAGLEDRFNEEASQNLIIPDSSTDTLRLGPITLNVGDFLSEREIPELDLRVPNMNVIAPIPGLEGISGELDVNGRELTIGIHIDVGRFLPEDWGFGPSLPTRLRD